MCAFTPGHSHGCTQVLGVLGAIVTQPGVGDSHADIWRVCLREAEREQLLCVGLRGHLPGEGGWRTVPAHLCPGLPSASGRNVGGGGNIPISAER